MTTTPITIPDIAFTTIAAKDGRVRAGNPIEANPFDELLFQAVEERSGVANGKSLSHTTVNALVEAVMSALRQAKESMGGALPPGLNSGDSPDNDSGWPLHANPLETLATHRTPPPMASLAKGVRHSVDASHKISTEHQGGNYDQIIKRAAERYDVDEDLIRSVVKVESSFNPKAVSPAGAMGMMQLMPGTAKELGVKNPFNAEENIMGGTLYLSRLLDRYDGNIRSALAAYNWGMGNLEKQPASAMPGETRRYVSRIMGMVDNKPMV